MRLQLASGFRKRRFRAGNVDAFGFLTGLGRLRKVPASVGL
jgi:hypothetical protein